MDISLSTWFREYLYIPLGGNRRGKARTFLNQMLVFAATGLWHGANVTFLVWGLFHGLFLVLESSRIIPVGKAAGHAVSRLLVRIYTLLVVLVGFVVFRADSLSQALGYLGAMVAGGGSMALSAGTLSYLTPWFCCVFLIGCITSFPVVPAARRALCVGSGGTRLYTVAGYGLSLLLFALCVLSLAADTYNPFIYFRF